MSIYDKLYTYQKKIVDMLKPKKSALVYLDMGLGKTAVMTALPEVHNCTKLIIITINAKALEGKEVDGGWFDWASKSSVGYENYYNMKNINSSAKKYMVEFSRDSKDVLLMNYEGLYERTKNSKEKVTVRKKIVEFIENCRGHNVAIVCDECHKLKNQTSLSTLALNKITKLCQTVAKNTYLYLGSGTPFTRGYEDLYSQLKLMGWEKNKQYFKDKFCVLDNNPGLKGYQQPIIGYKNIDELYNVIHQYGVTIKTIDVVDLPEKIFVNHVMPESDSFKFLCREKVKQSKLNEQLSAIGLPTFISDNDYYYLSTEEKIEYWSKFNLSLVENKWVLNEKVEIADITDSMSYIMGIFASIYQEITEYEGFEWLYDYYYLFELKFKRDKNHNVVEQYYEPIPCKYSTYSPNPFYRNLAYPSKDWQAETASMLWMRARQVSVGFQGNAEESMWFDYDRLEALKEFLKENEDNYLLFYNYTPELHKLYSICKELGYNIDIYCGETKTLEFYETYKNQSEAERLVNKKNIILANFVSGSTGLNLQLYNKCIIFSCPLFKDFEQGIKRINRLGQKQTCFYHIFYQDNWLDKGMRTALDEQVQYNDNMFSNGWNKIKSKILD